jgi:hypothetical protein
MNKQHRMTSLPDILTMQEVSRHAIHVGEVLGVTKEVLKKMTLWQVTVYRYAKEKFSRTYVEQMQEYTRFQLHVVQALIGRSDSNLSRLQNEITLVGAILHSFPLSSLLVYKFPHGRGFNG